MEGLGQRHFGRVTEKNKQEKLNRRLDSLVQDREALAMIAISQESLADFLTGEPDLYSVKDVKVAYR